MKRFYKEVSVEPVDGAYAVRLDGRQVKTPAKRALRLPGAALADAVAAEWAAQESEIDAHGMRLTRLTNTAIDRVADHRAAVVGEIGRYAETDLVCYRADAPEELARRQKEAWDPLVRWIGDRHGVALAVTDGLSPVAQPAQSLRRVSDVVGGFDDFSLAGLHMVTSACGSVVIGLAVADAALGGEAAWSASLVDETFQIEEWGEDAEATRRREALLADIEAAARFLALVRQDG
jgi:chaperone required for assembly of F1-ATPase